MCFRFLSKPDFTSTGEQASLPGLGKGERLLEIDG